MYKYFNLICVILITKIDLISFFNFVLDKFWYHFCCAKFPSFSMQLNNSF